jgi:hypothetical protein
MTLFAPLLALQIVVLASTPFGSLSRGGFT